MNLIFPAIFFLGCVFLVVVPIIAAPKDAAVGLGIMASGVPVYLVFIYKSWAPIGSLTSTLASMRHSSMRAD